MNSKYKDKVTLDILKELYVYWTDSGAFYRDKDYESNEPFLSDGYWTISFNGTYYKVHKLIYHIMGFDIPEIVDHINQNRSDNRWTNLRAVDKRQNNTNQGVRRDNSSGYKGVYFDKQKGKWMARITHHGKQKFLGYGDTPEIAALIYNEAVPLYHGEYGWRNPIGKTFGA